jgi:hypothetical protein
MSLRPLPPAAPSADWEVLTDRIERVEKRERERLQRIVEARAAVRAVEAEVDPKARDVLEKAGVDLAALDPLRRLLHDGRAKVASQLGSGSPPARMRLPAYTTARAQTSILPAAAVSYAQYSNSTVFEADGIGTASWGTGSDVDVQPTDPGVQWIGLWATGAGSGWFGNLQPYEGSVHWAFVYAPAVDGMYQIAPHFMFRGTYTIRADADWLTPNKIAEAGVYTLADVWQSYDPGGEVLVSLAPGVYGFDGQNVNQSGRFDMDLDDATSVFLQGDRLAIILAYAYVLVDAVGDGSHAEITFGGDDTDFIACPYMHVTQIS